MGDLLEMLVCDIKEVIISFVEVKGYDAFEELSEKDVFQTGP